IAANGLGVDHALHAGYPHVARYRMQFDGSPRGNAEHVVNGHDHVLRGARIVRPDVDTTGEFFDPDLYITKLAPVVRPLHRVDGYLISRSGGDDDVSTDVAHRHRSI